MASYNCPKCGATSGDEPRFPNMDWANDLLPDVADAAYSAASIAHKEAIEKWQSDWAAHFPCTFGDAADFDMTPYHAENSVGGVTHKTTRFADGFAGRDNRCKICMVAR